jgi:hypothetical protein
MATRKQTTKAGATVTTVPANAFTTVTPKAKAPAKAKAPKASPMPTLAQIGNPLWAQATTAPVAAAAAPVPVVALRTGPVVTAVALGPKVYRVKAAHTLAAWQAVQALMATGPAPMPAVLASIATHPSVGGATGFVQYCLRRGYLVAA